ncbi:hypothetical protein B0T10DRAFT_568527 [Thelonectria olida]|uniref:Uncharacterized protein n=1 Tax=Thelonectria olida TaxID=1576542 RepID=A0A9P8VRD1_9HYPO|nr:hypothetical protein B0T10DRAFT_569175 [Thelonectria olida]KAH6871051.1 hypothetical protein B0T10DRAFT_568527 [Thelonectria olida]
MDTKGWRARISRCFDKPPPCQQIDRDIRDLGGTTSAFDCMEDEMQAEKGSVSTEDHISALNEDIRRLRCELDYYNRLIQDVLIPLTPRILFHSEALCSAAQRCDVEIKRSLAQEERKRDRAMGKPLVPVQPDSGEYLVGCRGCRAAVDKGGRSADDDSDDLGSSDSSYSTESSEAIDTMDGFVVPDSQGEECVDLTRLRRAQEAITNTRGLSVQETEAASSVDSANPLLSSLERIGPAVDNLVRVLTDLRIESSFAIATQNQTWCCCHHRQPFPRRRSDGSQVFSPPIAFDDLSIHPALRERGDGFQN